MFQGDGHTSAPRAGVVDPLGLWVSFQSAQGFLYQNLGVRPGHQDPLIHVEFQAEEFFLFSDVGDGQTCAAQVDEASEAAKTLLVHRIRKRGEQSFFAGSQGFGEEHRGIEHGGVYFGIEEKSLAPIQGVSDGHTASFLRYSSRALSLRASTISSRSPIITSSRRYRVRLILWSVIRFWGKL
ncbi:hypothetical protein ES707_11354 [subsurface metagenome]